MENISTKLCSEVRERSSEGNLIKCAFNSKFKVVFNELSMFGRYYCSFQVPSQIYVSKIYLKLKYLKIDDKDRLRKK